jgi:hypothetical protein
VAGVEEMPGASASVVSRRGGEVGCRWSGGAVWHQWSGGGRVGAERERRVCAAAGEGEVGFEMVHRGVYSRGGMMIRGRRMESDSR